MTATVNLPLKTNVKLPSADSRYQGFRNPLLNCRPNLTRALNASQAYPLCFNALEVAFIQIAVQDMMPSPTVAVAQGYPTAALLPKSVPAHPPRSLGVEAGAPRLPY